MTHELDSDACVEKNAEYIDMITRKLDHVNHAKQKRITHGSSTDAGDDGSGDEFLMDLRVLRRLSPASRCLGETFCLN